MRAKFRHGTIVGPQMDSSHYAFSELPPSSYAAPPAARYTYGPGSGPSPVHRADYQTYCVGPDRPRCAQFSVHDVYDVGGRPPQPATAQYYGHHVALPPGPAAVYPGHQVVYPGEHFQIIGPPPATHYHHLRHHCPPPSSAATHFVPALYGDHLGAAPRQMAGCGETVSSTVTTSSTPMITAAQLNNVGTAGDVTRDNAGDVEPSTSALHDTSTTLVTAEHDITPTRDTNALFSASATISSTQLHPYYSGNLFDD